MEIHSKYSKSSCAKTYLSALFLPQILGIIAIMLLSVFFKDAEQMKQSYVYIITSLCIAQIAFLLIYWHMSKKHKTSNAYVNNIKINIKPLNIFICIVISIIAIVGLTLFVGLFDILFQKIGYKPQEQILNCTNFGNFILLVITSAILPAIAEELVFRDIIFNGLKSKGFVFAGVISSIMFMTVHLNLGSLIYPLIMGFVFAYVLHKSGCIIYTMIIHFCNNFFVLLIQYLNNVAELNLFYMPELSILKVLLIILLAVFSVATIIVLINSSFKSKQINNETQSKENTEVTAFEKAEDKKVYYSLAIGIVFWLLVVCLNFM